MHIPQILWDPSFWDALKPSSFGPPQIYGTPQTYGPSSFFSSFLGPSQTYGTHFGTRLKLIGHFAPHTYGTPSHLFWDPPTYATLFRLEEHFRVGSKYNGVHRITFWISGCQFNT